MKPSAPPPPPTPPQRRFESSAPFNERSGRPIDGHPDLLTPSFADPPTMAAARERVHAIARELPRSEQRFDDETQARPADEHKIIADRWSPHRRAEIASQNIAGEMDVPYDALPSLNQPSELPPPRDWNDRDWNDGDPSTQMRPEDRDRMGVDRFQDDSYNHNRREASYRGREDSHEQERGYDRQEESYRPPQDSFEADSFANPRDDRHGGRRDEDSFSAAPPAQKFGGTAAWPGTDHTDDSGPRARQPQYDVAAYEAHYGARRNDRDGSDSYRARDRGASYQREDRASYKREDRASYKREDRASYQREDRASYKRAEGPSQVGYQPTQQASLGDYPAPEPAESSRRERTHAPPAREQREESYRARKVNVQVYEDVPQIPPAPAVPRDMMPGPPAGFVMGVQPLRSANTPAPRGVGFPIDQFPPAHVVAAPRIGTPNMGIGVPYNAAPSTMAASPRAMTPMGGMPGMHHPAHAGMPMGMAMATPPPPAMHVRAASSARPHAASHYAGPVGHQMQMTEVEEAQQGSKVGRFAWFVFGAAFGIFFAFFATGFVPRLSKKDAEFPQPPPIPQPVVQQPQVAPQAPKPPPAPVQIQAPPPVVAAAAPPPPVVAPQPVVVQPAAPVPPPAAPAPQPAPIAQATPQPQPKVAPPPPAPRGSRAGSIARRAAPSPAPPPKSLPSSARDDDDDRPAPPAKKKGSSSDIGDLLNAGLGD